MLFAVQGMYEFAIAASLLSLGAIDFGLIIDGAVVMVTPRPMHDLDRYAEQLRERRVSANAVVVESPDGIVVADVADVVSFLASDAGRLIAGQNLPLRARVA